MRNSVTVETPAKVNLSLRVNPRDRHGYHPLRSLVQAIEPLDVLHGERAESDRLEIVGTRMAADDDNLVWQAVRRAGGSDRWPISFTLEKRIPTAAGLGGGSSDAAAALTVWQALFGVPVEDDIYRQIGADVPFFRNGGRAIMEGYGEQLSPLPPAGGFVLALVVPPFDLSTPRVYAEWDHLGGPSGFAVDGRDLPPSLREAESLTNDLYPAAVALQPELDSWRAELSVRWSRPVLMSGSGPSLFAFFGAEDEAAEAVVAIPPGTRFAEVVAPVDHGSRIVPDG